MPQSIPTSSPTTDGIRWSPTLKPTKRTPPVTPSTPTTSPSLKPSDCHHQPQVVKRPDGWVVVPESLAHALYVHFDYVGLTYANLIDYMRFVILIAGYGFCAIEGYTGAVAFIVMMSYILDWLDGPTARYTQTCTTLGAYLDWAADILTNALLALMWHNVAPRSCAVLGWTFFAAECTYMVFDIVAASRSVYADVLGHTRDPTYKMNFIERLVRSNIVPAANNRTYRYSNVYTVTWIAYPTVVCTLVCDVAWGGASSYLSFPPTISGITNAMGTTDVASLWGVWVLVTWIIGVPIAAWFCVVDTYLAAAFVKGWSEDRAAPSNYYVLYDDRRTNACGGVMMLRNKGGVSGSVVSPPPSIPTGFLCSPDSDAFHAAATSFLSTLFPDSFDSHKSELSWEHRIRSAHTLSTLSMLDTLGSTTGTALCVLTVRSVNPETLAIRHYPAATTTNPDLCGTLDDIQPYLTISLPNMIRGDVVLVQAGTKVDCAGTSPFTHPKISKDKEPQNTYVVIEFDWEA